MDDQTHNQTPSDDTQTTQSEPTDLTQDPGTHDALTLLDLERTIKVYHQGIQAKREELRKFKEMIDDTLENDAVYAEHTEMVNEAKRVQKTTKDALMNVSSVISTLEDMKELRNDVKDLQTHLSDNIMKYYDIAKTDRITMDDGETYMIKTSAKLVKESSRYNP